MKQNEKKRKHIDADDDDDDGLFQPIPSQDDCPICMLPLPIDDSKKIYSSCSYYTCCGNIICNSCEVEDNRISKKYTCPFCREPNATSDNEDVIRLETRMELNDSKAIYTASQCYLYGEYGLPKDPQKAFDLCLWAADLGNSDACCSVAINYKLGVVVPTDIVKAREYNKKAVNGGIIVARYNIGLYEIEKGNYYLACRHWLISAAAGDAKSLKNIAKFYKFELVTKEIYATTIASYRNVHKDEWSIERERAAAVDSVHPRETTIIRKFNTRID